MSAIPAGVVLLANVGEQDGTVARATAAPSTGTGSGTGTGTGTASAGTGTVASVVVLLVLVVGLVGPSAMCNISLPVTYFVISQMPMMPPK